jgi:hypothetical protein
VAADKKKLKDELAEEKCKTQEAMRNSTLQTLVRSKFCIIGSLVELRSLC